MAALGIAAHEVSHAYQDAEGSRVYRVRRAVGEPLAKLAPWSGFFFIGGFWLGVPILMVLAIAYVAGMVVFALATLPVEFSASRRALTLLRSTGLTDAEETGEVERVLRAAALTYVVGLLQQLGLCCSRSSSPPRRPAASRPSARAAPEGAGPTPRPPRSHRRW